MSFTDCSGVHQGLFIYCKHSPPLRFSPDSPVLSALKKACPCSFTAASGKGSNHASLLECVGEKKTRNNRLVWVCLKPDSQPPSLPTLLPLHSPALLCRSDDLSSSPCPQNLHLDAQKMVMVYCFLYPLLLLNSWFSVILRSTTIHPTVPKILSIEYL